MHKTMKICAFSGAVGVGGLMLKPTPLSPISEVPEGRGGSPTDNEPEGTSDNKKQARRRGAVFQKRRPDDPVAKFDESIPPEYRDWASSSEGVAPEFSHAEKLVIGRELLAKHGEHQGPLSLTEFEDILNRCRGVATPSFLKEQTTRPASNFDEKYPIGGTRHTQKTFTKDDMMPSIEDVYYDDDSFEGLNQFFGKATDNKGHIKFENMVAFLLRDDTFTQFVLAAGIDQAFIKHNDPVHTYQDSRKVNRCSELNQQYLSLFIADPQKRHENIRKFERRMVGQMHAHGMRLRHSEHCTKHELIEFLITKRQDLIPFFLFKED